MESIIYTAVILVVISLRGLTHGWIWGCRRPLPPLFGRARPFIKNYGEPHLASIIQNTFLGLAGWAMGVHPAICFTAVMFSNVIFNSLVDMGASGSKFWDMAKGDGWPLVLFGRQILWVPTFHVPKPIGFSLWLAALVASLVFLA